jgi:signal peptidase II
MSHSSKPVHPGLWLALAAAAIALDQLSKWLVVEHFRYGDSQFVTSFFNLVRAHNTGAAFSFLAGAGGWQRWFFVGLGTLASGFIVWMLTRHKDQPLFCFALSMILGGAIGNVIDRLVYGYVVDFLQFHWEVLASIFPGGFFPAFNLADSAITLGAICLIFDELRRARQPADGANNAARPS